VLACALSALVATTVPSLAVAAPRHNHGLTINATPNPIVTGDPVLIYGQLNGPKPVGREIVLYRRVNPSDRFTEIGHTTTDKFGFYEFTRVVDVVLTNRSWYVRAPLLAGNVHSRTVHERVAAAVSISSVTPVAATTSTVQTDQPVVFSGEVLPVGLHAGERVFLQSQVGSTGEDWQTVKSGLIGFDGSYSITYRFRAPGVQDLRVLFRGDVRNIGAASTPVTVTVQQRENPTFTINSSAPIIPAGQSTTISGVLYEPTAAPLTPAPGVNVTLWGREAEQPFRPLLQAVTAADGSYAFTVQPQHNTEYYVRTTFAPFRRTALLFDGVSNAVMLSSNTATSSVGQSVIFTGTVTPDKAGHIVDLQQLGKDGNFHTVTIGVIDLSSGYRVVWTFGAPGLHTFRTLVPGGPDNVSGESAPVTISVSLPAPQALPPAS
jgi:hypothetical protein